LQLFSYSKVSKKNFKKMRIPIGKNYYFYIEIAHDAWATKATVATYRAVTFPARSLYNHLRRAWATKKQKDRLRRLHATRTESNGKSRWRRRRDRTRESSSTPVEKPVVSPPAQETIQVSEGTQTFTEDYELLLCEAVLRRLAKEKKLKAKVIVMIHKILADLEGAEPSFEFSVEQTAQPLEAKKESQDREEPSSSPAENAIVLCCNGIQRIPLQHRIGSPAQFFH
jgi:hypothetical protein